MSKKTICALVAGFITTFGASGIISANDKDTQANSANERSYTAIESSNAGGWYSNKAQKGQHLRNRIYKYMG